MKILCMCQRGNNRSAALAYLLKDHFGHDAVAIGHQTAGDELKAILFNWADRIIVLEPYMTEFVPRDHHAKTFVCDVGPDVYGLPHNPGLVSQLKNYIEVCMP